MVERAPVTLALFLQLLSQAPHLAAVFGSVHFLSSSDAVFLAERPYLLRLLIDRFRLESIIEQSCFLAVKE